MSRFKYENTVLVSVKDLREKDFMSMDLRVELRRQAHCGFFFPQLFSNQLLIPKASGLEENFCNLLVMSVPKGQGMGRMGIFKW